MEKVRVLRVLEYVGTREWVEQTLKHGAVPVNGVYVINEKDGCEIRSAIINPFPDKVEVENG